MRLSTLAHETENKKTLFCERLVDLVKTQNIEDEIGSIEEADTLPILYLYSTERIADIVRSMPEVEEVALDKDITRSHLDTLSRFGTI